MQDGQTANFGWLIFKDAALARRALDMDRPEVDGKQLLLFLKRSNQKDKEKTEGGKGPGKRAGDLLHSNKMKRRALGEAFRKDFASGMTRLWRGGSGGAPSMCLETVCATRRSCDRRDAAIDCFEVSLAPPRPPPRVTGLFNETATRISLLLLPPAPSYPALGCCPLPLQGAQPVPSHCPPNAKCQPQWHLYPTVTAPNRFGNLLQPPA